MLAVMTFRTEAEAVAKANATPYGLAAGVWTENGSRILWMAKRLRAGVVWANTYNQFDPASPFGGMRESGFGREGGRHGLGRVPRSGAGRHEPTVEVRKTYKLFIGGAFLRSESGRTMRRALPDGALLAHVAQARARTCATLSRRARRPGGVGRSARRYIRGQILYRVAEMLDGRAAQFAPSSRRSAWHRGGAAADVEAAIDARVYWAGLADKLDQLVGRVNPVAGPFLNLSTPSRRASARWPAPTTAASGDLSV